MVFELGVSGGLPSRPRSPDYPMALTGSNYSGPSNILQRREPLPLSDLYDRAKRCNPLRRSMQSLRDYIFKEGIEFKEEYAAKCLNPECGFKHAHMPQDNLCEKCGSPELVRPDPKVKEMLEQFFKRVNSNGQSLVDVCMEHEDHLNTSDDGIILLRKTYSVDRLGKILSTEMNADGITAVDPRNFKLIMNEDTQEMGGLKFTCLVHRYRRVKQKDGQYRNEGQMYERPGKCSMMEKDGRPCDRPLFDCWYASVEPGTPDTIVELYLGDIKAPDGSWLKEVIHTHKYTRNKGYGLSPIYAIWDLVELDLYMTKYMRRFYEEEKGPRDAILIGTPNPEALEDNIKKMEDRVVSQGPGYLPILTYTPPASGSGPNVQKIQMSALPAELQLIENRKEIYQYIGAAFETTPVFLGINDAAGLQHQGPTQWRVAKTGAKKGQAIYNEKTFPALLQQFSNEGWLLRLKKPEDEDPLTVWNEKIAEATYAQTVDMMGFTIERMDDEGHFVFSRTRVNPMMGMMPGPAGTMDAPPDTIGPNGFNPQIRPPFQTPPSNGGW